MQQHNKSMYLVTPAITNMVRKGLFTWNDFLKGRCLTEFVTDSQILDILTLNRSKLACTHKSDWNIWATQHIEEEIFERIYALARIVRNSPERDIVNLYTMEGTNPRMTYDEEQFLLIQADENVLFISPGDEFTYLGLDYYRILAKLISDKHGYKVMVNVNYGVLFKNMIKRIKLPALA